MADNRLNKTGLAYFYNRLKTIFATKASVETLESTVQDLVTEGGEPNTINTVKVNGTEQTITNKEVDLTVPTVVSDLTNDSGYQTSSDVDTAITNAIAGITQFDFSVVTELPASGTKGVIYLVSNSGSGNNIYDEYIWVTNGGTSAFEKIGTTEVDLSGYWNETNLTAITTAEIDAIIDGE